MAGEPWYPGGYNIQPSYATAPTIHFWDLERFTRRRRRYWDAAWGRALKRWELSGLELTYHPGPLGCVEHGVTVEVIDVPPGIGAWAQYSAAPVCSFVQIDVTTWRNALRSRNIRYLTEVMTHEIGHVLGFGHGGDGIMSYLPDKPIWPNDEEIAAAREYWGTG